MAENAPLSLAGASPHSEIEPAGATAASAIQADGHTFSAGDFEPTVPDLIVQLLSGDEAARLHTKLSNEFLRAACEGTEAAAIIDASFAERWEHENVCRLSMDFMSSAALETHRLAHRVAGGFFMPLPLPDTDMKSFTDETKKYGCGPGVTEQVVSDIDEEIFRMWNARSPAEPAPLEMQAHAFSMFLTQGYTEVLARQLLATGSIPSPQFGIGESFAPCVGTSHGAVPQDEIEARVKLISGLEAADEERIQSALQQEWHALRQSQSPVLHNGLPAKATRQFIEERYWALLKELYGQAGMDGARFSHRCGMRWSFGGRANSTTAAGAVSHSRTGCHTRPSVASRLARAVWKAVCIDSKAASGQRNR